MLGVCMHVCKPHVLCCAMRNCPAFELHALTLASVLHPELVVSGLGTFVIMQHHHTALQPAPHRIACCFSQPQAVAQHAVFASNPHRSGASMFHPPPLNPTVQSPQTCTPPPHTHAHAALAAPSSPERVLRSFWEERQLPHDFQRAAAVGSDPYLKWAQAGGGAAARVHLDVQRLARWGEPALAASRIMCLVPCVEASLWCRLRC